MIRTSKGFRVLCD